MNEVKLTKREIEVLNVATQFSRADEIAKAIGISKRTVDFHLANAYKKLGVSSRYFALKSAARRGFIDPSLLAS